MDVVLLRVPTVLAELTSDEVAMKLHIGRQHAICKGRYWVFWTEDIIVYTHRVSGNLEGTMAFGGLR